MRPPISFPLPAPLAHLPATPGRAARSGRFAETRRAPWQRAAYRALSAWSPAMAARLAAHQLATPPRAGTRWCRAMDSQLWERRVRFGSGDLAVYEWGQGPTVLLVHGWGSNAAHLSRLVTPLLHRGFRVVAFDAPAHGRSSGRTTDMVAFANAIACVARHAGPLHAVVGHSFGAAMALYALRDWSVEAARLVLISPFEHCNWFVDLFARHMALTPEVQQQVRERFEQRYLGRFDWQRMSVVEMARQAHRPTLLVHDAHDAEVPFAHSQAIAEVLPGAPFMVTRGLGHQRVVRHPDVIRRIAAFLAD